jgi:hypothetical protein
MVCTKLFLANDSDLLVGEARARSWIRGEERGCHKYERLISVIGMTMGMLIAVWKSQVDESPCVDKCVEE